MNISLDTLRNEIVGKNYKFQTPYGIRVLTYADFTASARSLKFIEKYLLYIYEFYGSTHTEDDMSGEVMTNILSKSKNIIKKFVNGENNCYVIPAGTGTTGAIENFAKILGIYIPPATKRRIYNLLSEYIGNISDNNKELIHQYPNILKYVPVIFIGPYEHHSNILMWREGIGEVVEIDLNRDGTLDLADLKRKVSDKKYKDRLKIGSFSAASNVTGVLSPVFQIAEILHKNDALACFDFAACAPYVDINMNKSSEEYFDAIYFSPHKFIGGPGSCGILVINKKLYNNNIPPTVPGGGTVSYVSSSSHEYIENVEEREMSGTPGIMQIIKGALAIELKNVIGLKNIETKEKYYTEKIFGRLKKNSNIKILGPTDKVDRLPIFSINIKHNDKILHPKFVAKLLNDLFGIQARAGCACAAPYGHKLLDISREKSNIYREAAKNEISSIKPGWLRFNLHYTMTETQVDYICEAIEFAARYGYLFLVDYELNIKTGTWKHKNQRPYDMEKYFGIEQCIEQIGVPKYDIEDHEIFLSREYNNYIKQAVEYACKLSENSNNICFKFLDEKKYYGEGWFYYVNVLNA